MKHNWEYKRLGDVATYINGFAFKPSDWLEEGYPIIRIQNLNNSEAEYNYSNGEIPSKYFVSNGDLLISWSASLGAYIWQGGNAILNQHIFKVVFDKTEILRNYLKYFVDFSLPLMASKAHGATMRHITKPLFDALPIPYPPREVQEQIVAELDKINEVIEDCRELLRNLDALAQSLFYDYFGDPVTNPKGWETQKISDIAPQAPYKDDIPTSDKIWLLNLDMIEKHSGRIITHQKVRYEEIGTSVYKISPNQVLYSKLRPNLNKVVISDGYGYCTSELLPLNPKTDTILSPYLAYLLRTKECVSVFSGKVAGAKMPRTDLKVFRSFPIPVPPLSLQEEFAARIEQIDEQKKTIEETIANLQTLLDSRMDYWFN